jgi:hypothetical protein
MPKVVGMTDKVMFVKNRNLPRLVSYLVREDIELISIVKDCESNKYIVYYRLDREINERDI